MMTPDCVFLCEQWLVCDVACQRLNEHNDNPVRMNQVTTQKLSQASQRLAARPICLRWHAVQHLE